MLFVAVSGRPSSCLKSSWATKLLKMKVPDKKVHGFNSTAFVFNQPEEP